MAKRAAYKANISMKLIDSSGTETEIPSYYIVSVLTDYNYEVNFMPIIYVQLNVSLDLYDKLILENTDGKIYLNIKKYDIYNDTGLEKNDINDQFIYFLPTDANYTKEPDLTGFDRDSNTKSLLMGLLKIELMNLNKTSFNGTFVNTTTSNMMNLFLSDLEKIIMDEIEIDTEYDKLVVPPQNSRAAAIKFLFDENPFYTTQYNLFYDYKVTYITNRNGKPSQESGMNTVIFHINQISEVTAYVDGMVKDTGAGAYVIDTNVDNTSIGVNTTTEKDINQLVGAETDSVTITDLYINPSKFSNNKQMFIRSDEVETAVTKNILDNTSVMVYIAKANIDGSIITPDKAYLIKNYDNYEKYNGKFLLTRKKEILLRQDESFTPLVQVELRRISDQ